MKYFYTLKRIHKIYIEYTQSMHKDNIWMYINAYIILSILNNVLNNDRINNMIKIISKKAPAMLVVSFFLKMCIS